MTETAETTETTARHEATIESYVRFWNAATPEEQRRLAAATFSDDVGYHAEFGVLTGPAALIGFRDQFLDHMGTATLRARQEPTVRNDRGRLRWAIETGADEPFATGTDVLVFGADGRVSDVTSFLDRAPEGFDPNAHH